jgi:cobalt/nickel transport system permease protein
MKVPQSLRDLVESSESLVYVEDLSNKHGLMQSINPLINLIAVVFMIVASLFIFSLPYLALICIIPFILAVASRVPLKYLLYRTVWIPAFAALISIPILFITPGQTIVAANFRLFTLAITSAGVTKFLVFTIRVWFCVASLTLLVVSLGFEKLLKLLASLRIPPVIVQLFSLTYRYFFVSVYEVQSFLIAKEARTYIHRRTMNYQALKDFGAILAALFIRTYERSERVYLAMKSRGFNIENDHKLALPSFRWLDALFASSIIIAFALIIILLL